MKNLRRNNRLKKIILKIVKKNCKIKQIYLKKEKEFKNEKIFKNLIFNNISNYDFKLYSGTSYREKTIKTGE